MEVDEAGTANRVRRRRERQAAGRGYDEKEKSMVRGTATQNTWRLLRAGVP